MPVINMGMHGGLGKASYMEVSANIREGDIVLLMPEYLIFWSDDALEGNDLILAQWMEYDLGRLRFVSPDRYPTILLTIAQVKSTRLAAYLYQGEDLGRGTYLNSSFNSHGDFIGHLNLEAPTKTLPQDSYIKSDFFLPEGFDFLEDFNLDAKAKGVMVFLEFPASRDLNCRVTKVDKFERLYKALEEHTTIPVLTSPDEVCFPNSYFFDTIYHLNASGRRAMTERLIKDLLLILP